MSKVTDALQALTRLVHWMPRQQVLTLKHGLYSEEKEAIADLVLRAEEATKALPLPYGTEDQGTTLSLTCTTSGVVWTPGSRSGTAAWSSTRRMA